MNGEISEKWKEWLFVFRDLVKDSGLTQAQVAAKLDMSEGHFSQILRGSGRFLRREALERFFLLCRPDVTVDVASCAFGLYMTALSEESTYRELYERYQLLDRYDAVREEADRRAETVALLEREHAVCEFQVAQMQTRVAELQTLQRESHEEHARALASAEETLRDEIEAHAASCIQLAEYERRLLELQEELRQSATAVAEAREQRDEALLETAELREELAAVREKLDDLEEQQEDRLLADAVIAEAQQVVDHAEENALSVVSAGETTTFGAGQPPYEPATGEEVELQRIVQQLKGLRVRDMPADSVIQGHSLANRRIDELASLPHDRRLQLVAMLREAGQHIDADRLEAMPQQPHKSPPGMPLRRPPSEAGTASSPLIAQAPPEADADARWRAKAALAALRPHEPASLRDINELKDRAAQRSVTEVVELYQRLQREGRHREAQVLRSGTSERPEAERRHIDDELRRRQH